MIAVCIFPEAMLVGCARPTAVGPSWSSLQQCTALLWLYSSGCWLTAAFEPQFVVTVQYCSVGITSIG